MKKLLFILLGLSLISCRKNSDFFNNYTVEYKVSCSGGSDISVKYKNADGEMINPSADNLTLSFKTKGAVQSKLYVEGVIYSTSEFVTFKHEVYKNKKLIYTKEEEITIPTNGILEFERSSEFNDQ